MKSKINYEQICHKHSDLDNLKSINTCSKFNYVSFAEGQNKVTTLHA